MDKSSPLLLQACTVGEHFEKAKLVVRKAGTTPLEYIIITLTKVLVTSYSTGGSGGEDRLTENVSLNFAEYKFDYVPQKDNGTGDVAVTAHYDIAGSSAK